MALESLKQKLSSLPGAQSASSQPAPSRISLSQFSPAPTFNTRTAQSTPSIAAPGSGTIPTIKRALGIINPLKPTAVRPLFAKAGQEQTFKFGGPIVGIAHNIAARTIEAIPAIALTTIANFRQAKEGNNKARVNVPFDVSRLGITEEAGQRFVQNSYDKMVAKFDALEGAHPKRTKINIALASLSPVLDALDAVATGEILTSVARQGLRTTQFSPELNKALQQYGIQDLTGDELASEFVRKFNQKARKLIMAEDTEGLEELGRATNTIITHMSGKGVPSLNRLGKLVQDVSRIGLQDAKYGLRLKNPLFAELAPQSVSKALPGYVVEPGQAMPVGLSLRRVRRVGGEYPEEGPFFRSKQGGKAFEPIEEKNVMPAKISQELDTFVVKEADGFSVIEGKSGAQIGNLGKTMAEAVESAKAQISGMAPEEIAKMIDEAPLSPRYEIEDTPDEPATLKTRLEGLKIAEPIKKEPEERQVFYHGTPKENIASIEKDGFKSGSDSSLTYGRGVYLSEDENVARSYPEEFDGDKDVVKIEPTRTLNLRTLTEEERLDIANTFDDEQQKLIDTLLEDGKYDGFRIVHKPSAFSGSKGSSEVVVYDPTLLKTTAASKKIQKRINVKEDKQIIEKAQKPRPEKISNPSEAQAPKPVRPHLSTSEEDSYQALAVQNEGSEYFVHASVREEEKIVDNLTQIFADLKGVDVSDLKTKFTEQDLDQARISYEFAADMLIDHPGRALTKFISKKEGQFVDLKDPAKAKTPKERAAIEERNKKVMSAAEVAFEGTKFSDVFDDPDTIRAVIDDFVSLKQKVGAVQASFQDIRKQIRLSKQSNRFVASNKERLARETAKNLTALNNLVAAANRAGFRKGIKEGSVKLQAMIKRLKSRRGKIKAIQQVYDLTDGQMRDIRGGEDPRFMDDAEFTSYMERLETKAQVEQQKSIERTIIKGIVEQKDLKNTENLRLAIELPPLSKMSLDQLQEFSNILSQYQQFDSFLGPRMIQTIINTDLGPLKTVREIRAALAKETGASMSDLTDVRGDWADKFNYDAALAEKNPLYKYMVTEFTGKIVETDKILLQIEGKLNELAKASRLSKKRRISDKLVPQDKIVFQYLETPRQEKDLFARDMKMTKEELEYAQFVEALYRKWRDVLIDKGTLKKWREAYITHTSRSFFETWKDDGFIRAIRDWTKEFGDQRIDFDAIGPTGEVLGLEKFFKYSLAREGGLIPSKNVSKVVMQYANSFYKKQALDAMIPKMEAYTFSLQRPQRFGTPKDPTMIGIDGKLRRFVREWLNNKKGRRVEYIISQGGQLDSSLRALKLFISLKDLGINIISNTANFAGAGMSNFFGLSTKNFIKGGTRSLKKKGRRILREYPGVVGRPPFRDLINSANDVGDTFTAGMFYIMQELAYRAKGQFFLGSLTRDEYLSGIISSKRQAEIKLEIARFHPMDDMNSLVGSSSEGKIFMMYKTWAVPLVYTAQRNLRRTIRAIKAAEGLSGKAKVVKTREARELLKMTLGALGAYLFWNTVFGDDDASDQSGMARFKRRVAQELASSLSAFDPETWHKVRLWDFGRDLGVTIKQLITLEQYEKSGKTYEAGDLKGIEGLQRLLTPSAIRQFINPEQPAPMGGGSGSVNIPALNRLDRLMPKSGGELPALKSLDRLKKLNL